MITTLEGLIAVLNVLGFDYHERSFKGGFGSSSLTFLVIWCNEGKRMPFLYLYHLIGDNLHPIFWNDVNGGQPQIHIPLRIS